MIIFYLFLAIGLLWILAVFLIRMTKRSGKFVEFLGYVCILPFIGVISEVLQLMAEPQAFLIMSLYTFGVFPALIALGLLLTGMPVVALGVILQRRMRA